MKTNRRTLASALALAAALSLSACTGSTAPTATDSPSTQSSSSATTTAPQAKAPETATQASAAPVTKDEPGTALVALSKLQIIDEHLPNYDRDKFKHWTDLDKNGCDARQDTLGRFMSVTGCPVQSGTMEDPYTGEITEFINDGKGGGVDIDHVVSLSNAWKTGMGDDKVSDDQREQFANDPLNLVPTEQKLNTFKGDKDASKWLPSYGRSHSSWGHQEADCLFVARQVAVKQKYNLSVTTAEHDVISEVLTSTCPGQLLPTEPAMSVEVPSVKTPEVKKAPKKSASKPVPSKAPAKSTPVKSKPAASSTDPDMGSCKKAKAEGYGPYVEGVDEEYSFYRDADGDGTVCE